MFNLLKLDHFSAIAPREGRREPRHAATASVTLSCPGLGMFQGVLVDLSINGARIRTRAKVAIDSPILLEIDAMPLLSGTIIWLEGGELGMCFDRQLHEAVLDHLVEKSGIQRA